MAVSRDWFGSGFGSNGILWFDRVDFLEGGRVVWSDAQLSWPGLNADLIVHVGPNLCLNNSGLSGIFNLEKESAG